jgi:hypothetical protein
LLKIINSISIQETKQLHAMRAKYLLFVFVIIPVFQFSGTRTAYSKTPGNIDLDKFVREVYDLYQTDEVPVKQERLVYKKLTELMTGTQTMKITCSDSIAYDKKNDVTTVKSKEVYYADNKNGYFGLIVIFQQHSDALLMSTSPDKEITISGNVTDILVTLYRKGLDFFKCRTPIKEFDDSGTVIQHIILLMQG